MARVRGGDRREVAVLAACLVASALLFAFGATPLAQGLRRIEVGLLWPADRMRGFVEGVAVERAENRRLKQEIAQLRRERLGLLGAGSESERLRRALEFSQPRALALRAARVLGVAGEPWPLLYHLSVGRADGVAVGQPVIAPEGLVGRIEAVDARTSSVALLTDPLVAVACEVIPGGARGILRYRLDARPGLYLHHVPLTDTVAIDAEVATSGLSQHFPAGIPVGRVARLGRDPGGLVQEIEVRPNAPLTRLREVFVVVDENLLGPWPRPEPPAPDSAVAADSARTN